MRLPPPTPLFCDHCGEPVTIAGPGQLFPDHYIHADGYWLCASGAEAVVNGKRTAVIASAWRVVGDDELGRLG